MTTEPIRITQWSFSRWNDYEQCPFKAKLKYVLKMKEPENPAMARGSAIHKLAEDYTNGALKKLPAELSKFEMEFKALRHYKATAEKEWAFTASWEPRGWFDKDVWLRIKVDAVAYRKEDVLIIDHKTGRHYPNHLDQLELYAMGALLMITERDMVTVADWYLDSGEDAQKSFARNQLDALQKVWLHRTKAMLSDTEFAPKPGPKCKWCHFRKDNGGPCRYSG